MPCASGVGTTDSGDTNLTTVNQFMKSIKFISALALTLGMVACENYDLPNPPGQTNPEPDGYFENSGLVLAPVENAINLIESNEANKFVTVATITDLVIFPEGYDLEIDMQLGDNDQFSKSTTVATVIDDKNVTINPDVLNGAIQEVLTKKPGTYDVAVRFAAYASRGTTRMRLGGIDATYCPEILNVRTLDAAKVLEDVYYLVPCNAAGVPQMAQAQKMNNTAGNVSAYDNPEYALKFDVPAGSEYRFVIAPQSAVTAGNTVGVLGCNEAEGGLSGKLGESYDAGLVPINGSVLLTINVQDDSYSLNYAFEVLYPFSGTIKVEKMMKLYTTNYINYTGVTAINNQWVLAAQPDKNGDIVFRQSPDTEAVISENGLTMTGDLVQSTEASQIRTPVKGNTLYWADVNLVQQTYSITAIQSISIIGNHNGWTLETAPALTAAKDLRTWTINDVELDGEFEFNCNGAWDLDFGGADGSENVANKTYRLALKGGNMTIEKGKYDVVLDFSSFPYIATFTKK